MGLRFPWIGPAIQDRGPDLKPGVWRERGRVTRWAGSGFNDFRGLGSDIKDFLTNGMWERGDDGPCRVFSVWVAVLQRGEGRVWMAVLFENGPWPTFTSQAVNARRQADRGGQTCPERSLIVRRVRRPLRLKRGQSVARVLIYATPHVPRTS
jgi:hypothetical protein